MKDLEELELGWYFILVRTTHSVSSTNLSYEEQVEVRKLEKNISGKKYFAPRCPSEQILNLEIIKQDCSFKEIKETVISF